MESKDLEIIKAVMEQLQNIMKPSTEDFEYRTGRKKPAIEIEVEESPMHEGSEDCMPEDEMEDEEMPEMGGSSLKQRLMKLRG